MLINTQELPQNCLIEADVVIIGSGIAGITIARELRHRSKSVCVLESGGEKVDARTQALCRGLGSLSVGQWDMRDLDAYLLSSRVRAFGGTGNIWGAKVSTLEAADMEARPWVPHSGWPFGLGELMPYYERTASLLKTRPFGELAEALAKDAASPIRELADFEELSRQYSSLTGRSASLDYEEFKQSIADVPNIAIYLHANVVEIDLAENCRSVHALRVACLNGARHTVKASTVILATGGLENARLLLASNKVAPRGIGNDHDQVGRFFSGHLGFSHPDGGVFFDRAKHDLGRYFAYRGRAHSIISLSQRAQREHQVPQFGIYFKELRENQSAIDGTATRIAQSIDRSLDVHSGLSGGLLENFYGTEHLPNPESRVVLADEKDELGVGKIALRWRLQEQDLVNLNRGIDWFSRELGRFSQGRVRFGFDLSDPETWASAFKGVRKASHHIGTTRMHANPKQGVVDVNCRLHSVENLFVAGCSVFPTMGGLSNPTFTIVALALRLSDHLKGRGLA